ncbi:MAG TPA: MBOAT family O-acyltransferase [Fimbriimonadaceae bacterium]|nr:MBOAT family O-acyltransferase [Fimbriimonadaceae bacterium]
MKTPLRGSLELADQRSVVPFLVGLSYITFRLSHLAQEVSNGVARMPSVLRYYAFAFFPPTLVLGPISPYSRFEASLDAGASRAIAYGACAVRMLIGAIKYLVLGTILNHFTYQGLLLDGRAHGALDLALAIAVYPLFLFCNFSGFCDLAIGAAGLAGISVAENFDYPFAARNLQEFWNRWHMTLSGWFRDLFFTPFVKAIGRTAGAKAMPHVIALGIVVTFLFIGIWHGSGLNFALFGLSHGLGVATAHYWIAGQKRRLGPQGFAKLRESKWIRLTSVVITYSFFALSLVLFANSMSDLAKIARVIHG